MVRDCWYVIAESREVSRGRPLGLVRFGVPLVLWRDAGGRLACVADRCPHRGATLSTGRVVGGTIECFFHGFCFDARGACTRVPANGPEVPIPKALTVTSYEVGEEQGFIFLFWGQRRETYPPLPSFDLPDDSFIYSSFVADWPAHITRVVENQLDFTHLPFTHKTTIGRGVPGRLAVLTEVEGDRIKVRYDPKTYAGAGEFFVELHAPNLWRNRLSAHFWVVAAFVPIDEESTRTYLRFYQDLVRWPLVGRIICWTANLLNRAVLEQDRRRVVSQRPKRGELGIDEVLLPSDRPIVEYRRWRKKKDKPGSGDPSAADP